MMYVDVLLPLDIKMVLSYQVLPQHQSAVSVGVRVIVALGAGKLYSAIVYHVHQSLELPMEGMKPILSVLDTQRVVTDKQIELWRWIASYYMCSLGQICARMFPSSMKMASGVSPEINNYDFAQERYLQTTAFVSLAAGIDPIATLEGLRRAPRQQACLSFFLEKMYAQEQMSEMFRLDRKELIESGISAALVAQMVKKGILVVSQELTERKIQANTLPLSPNARRLPALTELQQQALRQIESFFDERLPILLHGVSGAGKTEVYAHLIEQQLLAGKSVLLLIPELALTAQIVERMKHYFGSYLREYTSRLTPLERYKVYNAVLHGSGGEIIVGTKNAVGLPFKNLGLVIVDEEHDASYKQNDYPPLFHARDVAVVMGQLYGIPVLLGSATPSLESYYNAYIGKYQLVQLSGRFNEQLTDPLVTVIERRLIAVKEKKEKGFRNSRYFSEYLLRRIAETIDAGEQVLLFQNRRGHSSFVECSDCGYIPVCSACNVSMTYHKASGSLKCHYCGATESYLPACPSCASTNRVLQGIGTENIEEKIAPYFPQARIVRLDSDILTSKARFNDTLACITARQADIIVGTQIVGKGFDFPGITLVGVINADNLLGFPDFRASERGFQLLYQLLGRLSRGERSGEMIIQSNNIDGGVVDDVRKQSYLKMYHREIVDRQRFYFPPFVRMITFTLKHADNRHLDIAAGLFYRRMNDLFGRRISHPVTPSINKIRNKYLLTLTLRIEKARSVAKAKELVGQIIATCQKERQFSGVDFHVNVDV